MPKPTELTGIGEFARRIRLSVKQLRNYDELGLLAPAYVDPDSGYRYYHRGQARTAVTISLLRSLDVPLADVHELLVADRRGAGELLDRQRARLEAEVDRRLGAIRSLDRLLAGEDLLPYEVSEREEPAAELAGLRGACTAEELEREAPALIGSLVELLEAEGSGTEPVVGLYPLDLQGEIEFFVGVDRGALTEPPPIEWRSLPAARVAATTHVGRYEELQLAYYPLIAHAEEGGARPETVVREVYLEGPPEVAAERARTEVLLPLASGEPDRPNPEERSTR
jgi:DNA-binding transcriptional MerR regulator